MSPKLTSPPSGAAEHSVNSIAMPRLVRSSADGSADEVDELQRALALCKTHCLALQDEVVELKEELTRVYHVILKLEDRVRALEQQNEAAPRRQQERGVEGDVRNCFRLFRNYKTCGLAFCLHRNHQTYQFCCGHCRKGEGHSKHCGEREAGFSAEKITVRRALPVTLQLIVPYAMLSKISTTSKISFSTVLQISSPGTGTSLRQVLPQYLQPAGKEIR